MTGCLANWARQLRRTAAAAACLALVAPWAAPAASPPGLLGNWQRADGSTRISITPCGAQFCAVNTWVKNPNGSEKIGDKLIMTLQQAAPEKLAGRAFDVRRQQSYSITVRLNGDSMTTSGCILYGVLCRTSAWNRAS